MILAIIIGACLVGVGLLALFVWGFACEAVARGSDDHWVDDVRVITQWGAINKQLAGAGR